MEQSTTKDEMASVVHQKVMAGMSLVSNAVKAPWHVMAR
jgi:hypothetical protein